MMSAVIILLGLTIGCSRDKVSYDGALRLEFSADTIKYDTIFTALGSTTKMFKVYNRAANRLCISSIALGESSKYQMSVDGVSGYNFSDVYINAQDSMTIFVQVKIDPSDEKLPFVVFDSIRFLTNGNNQNVFLEAYGQEAVRLNKAEIAADTTFTDELPYLISDTLTIAEGATLTLNPGARLFFRKNGLLLVKGRLLSEGEPGDSVQLRGDRSDYMNTAPPLSYDLSSAQWQGVVIASGSFGNRLSWTDLRNPTIGIVIDSTSAETEALIIENSVIRNSSGDLISSRGAKIGIYNSLVYNAGGYVLKLEGGSCDICHATFANYYGYSWGSRTAPLALLGNGSEEAPLGLTFTASNSIFVGSYGSEISFAKVEGQTFDYSFKNCFVKISTGSLEAGHYTECIHNQDPMFEFQGWSEEFANAHPHQYDFHLRQSSPAINEGSSAEAARYPYDLDGYPRPLSGGCCMGAYEYH